MTDSTAPSQPPDKPTHFQFGMRALFVLSLVWALIATWLGYSPIGVVALGLSTYFVLRAPSLYRIFMGAQRRCRQLDAEMEQIVRAKRTPSQDDDRRSESDAIHTAFLDDSPADQI